MTAVATATPRTVAKERPNPGRARTNWFGPALIVAATGIGASDIIATSVAGARFGPSLLWGVLLGAAFKGVLAEGIARWQIHSGTTLLHGIHRHLPRWVLFLFAAYLLVWTIGVAAAVANGCGLAVENLSAGAISKSWGAVACVIIATAAAKIGGFGAFSRAMKILIIAMFVTVIFGGLRLAPSPHLVFAGFVPTVPNAAGPIVLSLVGGIGGSMTLLSYNYLPQQAANSFNPLRAMRIDIAIAYAFTALFGISMLLIASQTFHGSGLPPADTDIIRKTALTLATAIGPAGFYIYSVGFLAAVLASLLGTWQTIPLLVADCYALIRRFPEERQAHAVSRASGIYYLSLGLLAVSGVVSAFVSQPIILILCYTIVASLIVPFIAAVLLYLNSKAHALFVPVATGRRYILNCILVLTLVLFLIAAFWEILRPFLT
jgi:Mn2+/Fe2+ NRAMP family transporter